MINKDAHYLVWLGLSLTMVMATTLFALVGINPKGESYQWLPWMYAGGCAVLAGIFGLIARRYHRQLAS